MKRCYGPGCAGKCERLLAELRHANSPMWNRSSESHDTLLFLRAFPQSATVAKLADELLAALATKVSRFMADPADASKPSTTKRLRHCRHDCNEHLDV